MTRALHRTVAVALLGGTLVLGSAGGASAAVPSPDKVTPGFAVFVVKDQAGGAYWLTTTTAVAATSTGADDGRNALLTVNQDVLLPAQQALGL
ncbi:MAG: hypothetical protein JWN17_2018 [Frankiales bacterium]|nr:hypothetical protein [Frankiales bacterium]